MKKRRKKLKIKNILLTLFLLFLIVSASIVIANKLKEETDNLKNEDSEDIIKEEEKPTENTLSLVMVGDALIHDRLYNDAKTDTGYDFKPYINLIKEKVKDYDVAYYNQETILGGTSIGLSSYPSFNSPQELGDAMIDAGFNLVSLATNHTLDRGVTAIEKSREYWNKQDNVQAVGSYTSYQEKETIESKIMETNGITYAMLNYTYGTNGISIPNGKKYLVNLWDATNNYEGYKETVKKDIESLRDKVDILIVAMHWGVEYTHTPTKLERETAKYLASLDVDIIIGTHPHVIQPVEWVDDTLVFYSLGNFISAQTSSSCNNYLCNIGLMSSLTITKTEYKGETTIKIDNIENDLIYTYHNNYQDYKVIPFSNKEIKKYLKNYEQVYEKYAKIIDTTEGTITTVPLAKY